MHCSECGSQLGDRARFCSACGAAVRSPAHNTRRAGEPGRRRVGNVAVALAAGFTTAAVTLVAFFLLDTTPPADDGGEISSAQDDATLDDGAGSRVGDEATESPSPESSASPSSSIAPQQATDFSALYREVGSGVLMVQATTCDGTGVGSAFATPDGRIVTAAHVVAGAASVAVVADEVASQAVVVGIDEINDVAILETEAELDAYEFEFADDAVSAGEALAVIGHPLGEPLTITSGTASRVDSALWPNFQIDASVNPGNSGGPVVRADGEVVGMAVAKDTEAEGLAYAVRTAVIVDRVAEPQLMTRPVAATCGTPLGPDDGVDLPEVPAADTLESAVAATLASYFSGINSGDYQLAFDQLSPRRQEGLSAEDFGEGLVTSYDFDFDLRSVEPTDDGAAVWLEFTSLQAPEYGPDGEACTQWSLDYQLVWDGYGWLLIDSVRGHGDSGGHTPCE